MKLPARQFLLAVTVTLASQLVSAQQTTQPAPFQSWGGGPVDSVNLGNLDIHLTIPVLHKAGRGMPFAYDISYDAQVWSSVTSNGTTQWQPSNTFGWMNISGAGMGGYVSYSTVTTSGQCPINPPYTYGTYTQIEYYGFVYHDAVGFSHQMSATAYYITTTGCTSPPNGPQPTQAEESVASDGSGYTFYVGPAAANSISGYVVTKSGTTIDTPFVSGPPVGGSGSPLQDANGNIISESGGTWTDTLGTQVLALVGTPPSPTTFTYISPAGNEQYTANYAAYNIKTNFGCSGITEYSADNVSLVSSIVLPDGSQYSFAYEGTPNNSGYTTGRISQVTLPAGGTISYNYTYTGSHDGINCTD